jgi:hypothetical protein
MRRSLAFLLLLLAAPAFGQTTVRVKDSAGNVVCELTIPAGGGVEVIHPGPGPVVPPQPIPPAPVPPAPIPPAPVPPGPAVGRVKYVVIIRDDRPGAMTPGQLAALRDDALRQELRARKLQWDVFDVSSAEMTTLNYAKWFSGKEAIPGLRAPALLMLDAPDANKKSRLVQGLNLPADSASILAAIKAQVGG